MGNEKKPERLFIFKPWFLVAIAIGIAGGCSFEWIWRTRVASGVEASAISAWIEHSSALHNRFGDISSANIERAQTTFSYSIDEVTGGCYHYSLRGTKLDGEIWITWRKGIDGRPMNITKLEILAGSSRQTISMGEK
jgi:hypothetical protein